MRWVTKTNKQTGTGNLELTDKIMALYRKNMTCSMLPHLHTIEKT